MSEKYDDTRFYGSRFIPDTAAEEVGDIQNPDHHSLIEERVCNMICFRTLYPIPKSLKEVKALINCGWDIECTREWGSEEFPTLENSSFVLSGQINLTHTYSAKIQTDKLFWKGEGGMKRLLKELLKFHKQLHQTGEGNSDWYMRENWILVEWVYSVNHRYDKKFTPPTWDMIIKAIELTGPLPE